MTVRELINLLRQVDPTKKVIINMGMRGADREVDDVEDLDSEHVGINAGGEAE